MAMAVRMLKASVLVLVLTLSICTSSPDGQGSKGYSGGYGSEDYSGGEGSKGYSYNNPSVPFEQPSHIPRTTTTTVSPTPAVCPEACIPSPNWCPANCKATPCPDKETCRRNPSRCPEYCRPSTTPKPFNRRPSEGEEEILAQGHTPRPNKPTTTGCPDLETCRRNPERCPTNCRENLDVCPDRITCLRDPERCPDKCKPQRPTTPKPFNRPRPYEVHAQNREEEHKISDPFAFTYAVKDQDSGNDYSHVAESKDDVITGEYRTLMADGRTQIVKYTSDWKNGHRVKITYEGQIIPWVRRPQ